MKHPSRKQSILLAALAVVALALGGVCFAADGDAPAAPTPPPAAAQAAGPKAQSPAPRAAEMRAKLEKFMEDSKALRRELFVVESAFKAQSRAAQPNDALIRELAGRIFDLKDQLMGKARERGLPPRVVETLLNPAAAQGGHGGHGGQAMKGGHGHGGHGHGGHGHGGHGGHGHGGHGHGDQADKSAKMQGGHHHHGGHGGHGGGCSHGDGQGGGCSHGDGQGGGCSHHGH